MKLYKNAGNIKSGLFILGIVFVILLLGYTQVLVNELRKDNREVVRLYASFIANIVQDENETNLNFILTYVRKSWNVCHRIVSYVGNSMTKLHGNSVT